MECHFPSLFSLSAKMIFFFYPAGKGILSAPFDNLMLLL